MTIDKSLKIRRGLIRTRNVLTRAERLKKLMETDRWQEGDPPFGLPKVRVQTMVLKKKKKKEEDAAEEGEGADADASDAAKQD
ncbi:MAG: small basic protein [Planctomycetales bacterium]